MLVQRAASCGSSHTVRRKPPIDSRLQRFRRPSATAVVCGSANAAWNVPDGQPPRLTVYHAGRIDLQVLSCALAFACCKGNVWSWYFWHESGQTRCCRLSMAHFPNIYILLTVHNWRCRGASCFDQQCRHCRGVSGFSQRYRRTAGRLPAVSVDPD